MLPKSLKGLFITSSALVLFSLVATTAFVNYELRQVEKINHESDISSTVVKESLKMKFYTVQI